MKNTLLFIVCISNAVAVFAQIQTAPQTQPAPQTKRFEIDGYAARVNDRVITRSEVREMFAPMLPELYRTLKGAALDAELEKAFARALDELIDRALILEAFAEKGGQIPDQYVNDEIKRVIKNRFKGDEASFEQVLTAQKQTRGDYMEDIREQISIGMMMNEEVTRRARITPERVREEFENNQDRYYIPEKVKYSVIVLNKGTSVEDQAVKLLEAVSILERLSKDADFGTVAREVSEGSRAAEGGVFPWMQPKDVRPELQETLKTLPAGEISPIIETETELYILKLEARQQPGHKEYEDVRQAIKAALVAKEQDRLKERWLTRLEQTNYVLIYNE
jgi:peptidyl-prolyl cis-trans isomerase SurA